MSCSGGNVNKLIIGIGLLASSIRDVGSKNEGNAKNQNPKRSRGQQPGSKGHGRTERPDLPEKTEDAKLHEEPVCPCCNKPYIPDENKEIEI